MLSGEPSRLVYTYDSETVWVEPWGPNALRVRATKTPAMPTEEWALGLEQPPTGEASPINMASGELPGSATITNGAIAATMTAGGKLTVRNSRGAVLLEEFARNRRDVRDPNCSALEVLAREFRPVPGTTSFRVTARFESVAPDEKIFGMGQYQQPYLDLKGCDVELAHRNSQASVPFAVSSLGYGFLWNNPAVGRAVFGRNVMTFEAHSTTVLDYWIVAGDTPAEIVRAYAEVTGKPPMMPEYGLGFWQCKLRYQTQEELLEVARGYKERGLPLDVIVVDFFHWPLQGEWKFDPTYWPDPGECSGKPLGSE